MALCWPAPAAAQPRSSASAARPGPPAAHGRDGQRDFDFEIGTWRTQLKRRLEPLTGSNTWVEYTGTSVVRKVWGGRANLVELQAEGAAGRIDALSLRLYDPEIPTVEPQLRQRPQRRHVGPCLR